MRATLLALGLLTAFLPVLAAAQDRGGGGEGPGAGRTGAESKSAPAEGKGKGKKKSGPAREKLPPPAHLETGSYPTIHPKANDALSEAFAVHEDTSGGCDQKLLTLAGAEGGGFAAVWQDERQGNIGLFLGRLGVDGTVKIREEPISEQLGTARELHPAVAATADGSGAIVWMKMSGKSQAQLRFFAPEREDWTGLMPLASPQFRRLEEEEAAAGKNPREARGKEGIEKRGAPNMPSVAAAGERAVVSWQESGRVYLQPFVKDYPEHGPIRLNNDGLPAAGAAPVALDSEGRALCAWDTEEGIALVVVAAGAFDPGAGQGEAPRARPEVRSGGAGKLLRLRADPTGGWWLLAHEGEELKLRHLAPDGSQDREELAAARGAVRAADFVTWSGGIVLALDRASERATESAGEGEAEGDAEEGSAAAEAERVIQLLFRSASGEPGAHETISIPASPDAQGVFLATEGASAERVLVAWTDERETHDDVLYALASFAPDGGIALAEPARWNTDVASSYQLDGAIASIGDRAVIAWEDERASEGHIYYRLIDGRGAWLGGERPAGGDEVVRERAMQRAAAAMNDDGRFLLTWKESAGPRQPMRVRAQSFAADGAPSSPPFDLDPGFASSGNHAAPVVALMGNQGYVCVWVREGFGPVAQRISLSGELVGAPWRVTDRSVPTAANPALLRLSPRKLVCVWDELAAEKVHVLSGRFLGSDATPIGRDLFFEWSDKGGDIDPDLALGKDGGFVMSWTANDGPPRDIWARFFDAEGRPTAPPIAISTTRNEQDFSDVERLSDGSFLVVWEDDLSGTDHAIGRRISADGTRVGPPAALDPWDAEYIETRHAPRVAQLGEGFLCFWADHGGGRGVDVIARRFGLGFDRDLEEPVQPEEAVEEPEEPRRGGR